MIQQSLKEYLEKYLGETIECFGIKEKERGDYFLRLAFLKAQQQKKNCYKVARNLARRIPVEGPIGKVTVEPPGFINIFLNNSWLQQQLPTILKQREHFGFLNKGKGKRVLIEFVSANPTGPLHLGNARGGPIGDVLANILEQAGYKVTREFYVNDTGNQVRIFGESLMYWYQRQHGKDYPFPKEGYQGEYLKELVRQIKPSGQLNALYFAHKGMEILLEQIKEDCKLMGVHFDNFVYESEILRRGLTNKAIQELKRKKRVYEKDNALWFDDYVLIRSDADKTPTYFANDLGYHLDKKERGFDKVINVLGANTYGHIQKINKALEVLGIEKGWLETILYQTVRLKHGDKIEKMSKRLGIYVTARQVLNEVSKDVFRFLMIERSPQTHLDFDLELAKKQTLENPVFYLQYAYARICGIIKQSRVNEEKYLNGVDFSRLNTSEEIQLIKTLLKLPDKIGEIAESYEIHRFASYALEVAQAWHLFYEKCPVLPEKDLILRQARFGLVKATQYVLKKILNILGVEPRERM